MAAKTSATTHDPRTASQTTGTASRFVAITFTGLGVVAIAACAVVLSYNGIYQIARQGTIEPRYAHLYPGAFTLLLLLSFWTSYVLRDAPRARRLGVDAIILALILLAAFASSLGPLGYVLLPDVAVVVTAVAPWVALLIAFHMWLWMVSHLRGERAGAPRRWRGQRPAEPSDAVDTTPLPVEPVSTATRTDSTGPGPAEPPESTPTTGNRTSARGTPTLLWPPSGKGYAGSERSVRVLDDSEVKARDTTDTDTDAPTRHAHDENAAVPATPAANSDSAHTDDEADDDTGSIIPFSRTTPGTEEETPALSSPVPAREQAATTPLPTTRVPDNADTDASETEADIDPAGEPDKGPTTGASTESGGAPTSDMAPKENKPDQPTLGQLLRRRLLPGGERERVAVATGQPEPTPPLRSDLPKRTPKSAWNRTRDTVEPADLLATHGDLAAGLVASGESADAGSAPGTGPEQPEDGFVHLLPLDDPTTDEADPRGAWTASPEPGPEASQPMPETASRVEKRPMVLKPRRSPISDLPADPPSGRVRSEPVPPELTQE